MADAGGRDHERGVDAVWMARKVSYTDTRMFDADLTLLVPSDVCLAGAAADVVQWSSYTVDHSQPSAGKSIRSSVRIFQC